ncbi:MAG: FxsA family protein [Phyllobacteriaceae bacterium]|nr:FxsA family protein [Phyllobacteriaceae bacterium]
MGLIRLLPFALLAVPLAEIAMFILVGNAIGVLPTIGLVIVTAVCGATLLRVQGMAQLTRIQRDMAAGGLPTRQLVHGAMMVVAGILLLTPGFITDTLGLMLFIPAVREAVFGFLAARIRFATPSSETNARADGFWPGQPANGDGGDRP